MRIDRLILEDTSRRSPAAADLLRVVPPEELKAGYTGGQQPKLARRRSYLAEGGATPSSTEEERLLGDNDLVDEFYLERALVAAKPVCRVIVRNAAGREVEYGTGFMVSPSLLLTNWHVLPERPSAENGVAEFDYRFDIRGEPAPSVRFALRPGAFFRSFRALDYALVAVEPRSQDARSVLSTFGFHRLIPTDNKISVGEWITIIQHPGGQRRQFSIRENQLLEKLDDHLWYRSDTAPGSSGAPAFNDSFQVVALHHSGKAKKENGLYVLRDGRTVASLADVDDSDVVWIANEGVRASVICAHLAGSTAANDPYLSELLESMKGGDIMSRALNATEGSSAIPVPMSPRLAPATPASGVQGSSFVIPLQLNISLSLAGAAVAAPAAAAPASVAPSRDAGGIEAPETLKKPIIDTTYSNRKGYRPKFLGVGVDLPTVSDLTVVAKMDNGKFVLPYQHFSVVMHRSRRLALFTASNVDASEKGKFPDLTAHTPKDYTRDALGGFSENDVEQWVLDPRIRPSHQLPDRFFTEDRQSFDKGHVVRREDVCWGKDYATVRRANGDTYHTTNCSPQILDFNRSASSGPKGGPWGDLENFILKQAKSEKLCLFAGPVLSAEDPEFEGKDDLGPVTVQIPRKFWKVVVAVKSGALKAFAFELEQSLSGVRMEEFLVSAKWVASMVRISNLEKELKIVKFPKAVRDADQFSTPDGESLKVEHLGAEPAATNGRPKGRAESVDDATRVPGSQLRHIPARTKKT